MKIYKTIDEVPSIEFLKTLPTPRLLNVYRKVMATKSKIYEGGYCCEMKCFHYMEPLYKNDGAWNSMKYKEFADVGKQIKALLDKREHVTR